MPLIFGAACGFFHGYEIINGSNTDGESLDNHDIGTLPESIKRVYSGRKRKKINRANICF